MTSQSTTKKDLDDFLWLLEHPEYEHRVVDIRTFIDSPDYLNASKECWSSVKEDLKELFSGNYTEAVFCEAIGAGKSYKSSIIITYMVYRVLCLKDPQEYFGLARRSTIVFLNMSIRADQSKKVVFGEVKARIDNSPWFRKNHPPDPSIHSELRFSKGIIIFPGNSQETFPLGFNILGGVMDEAAFYTETDTHDVAEDMFNALHSRIKNRFGDKGLLVMISSPRYVYDFIERNREFSLVEKSIDPNLESPVDEYNNFKPWFSFKGSTEKWHFIHVDLSHRRDATGFAMVHLEKDIVIADLMLRIKAPPGGEIIFSQIRDMIFELKRRKFFIRKITFDGWQSIDSIQILQYKGFNCEVLSVDKDTSAYDTLKDVIYTQKFKCYRYEPFLEEMRRLELIEGRKVDHPPVNGSKDISDAVAGAVFNCIQNKNNFSCGFAGGSRGKTEEEIKKEAEVLPADGLMPYGYMRGRRK